MNSIIVITNLSSTNVWIKLKIKLSSYLMLFIHLFHEYTRFFIGAAESEHKWTCGSNRAVLVYNRRITVKVNLRLYLSAVTRFTRLWTLNKLRLRWTDSHRHTGLNVRTELRLWVQGNYSIWIKVANQMQSCNLNFNVTK